MMKGFTAIKLYLFLVLSFTKVTLGAWHGESTSTSQEEIENITKHASKDNMNSYVSFQRGEDHICGGARMKVDQALTIKPCFDLISQYFWETYAMIPALQVQPYEIGQFKKVNDKFFIIMLEVPHDDRQKYDIPMMHLMETEPDKNIGGTVVVWDEDSKNSALRHPKYFTQIDDKISSIYDNWLSDPVLHSGYIGDLLFQHSQLAGMAVERSEDPPIDNEMKSTDFENIYRSAKQIKEALNRKKVQEFAAKPSLLHTMCNLGSRRGYTKLS